MTLNRQFSLRQGDFPVDLPVTAKGQLEENRRLLPNETFRWEPEKSAFGPGSVLLSRYNSRVVVIRNAIEIGRSRIVVKDPQRPLGTHVYVVKAGATPGDPASRPTWVGVGVVGYLDAANTQRSADAMQRIVLPDECRRADPRRIDRQADGSAEFQTRGLRDYGYLWQS